MGGVGYVGNSMPTGVVNILHCNSEFASGLGCAGNFKPTCDATNLHYYMALNGELVVDGFCCAANCRQTAESLQILRYYNVTYQIVLSLYTGWARQNGHI